jgi:recombination protein RecT
MSTNALKAAATGNQVAQHNDKPTTLAGLSRRSKN